MKLPFRLALAVGKIVAIVAKTVDKKRGTNRSRYFF